MRRIEIVVWTSIGLAMAGGTNRNGGCEEAGEAGAAPVYRIRYEF